MVSISTSGAVSKLMRAADQASSSPGAKQASVSPAAGVSSSPDGGGSSAKRSMKLSVLLAAIAEEQALREEAGRHEGS